MKTTEKIFKILFEAQGFVSGEALAQELALSRTAIWKAMTQLEKAGLVIESVKNKGYRLVYGDLLLAEEIATATGLTVKLIKDSQSTQQDAKDGIKAGETGNVLYLAPSQAAAHGRFGRPFFAPAMGGIYMSLHLAPQVKFADMPAYTVLVAASVVKAIYNLTGIDTQIKWVNDIYLGQKKIAGILTEAVSSIETGTITDVIIGMGLNFCILDFPDDIKDKAGSLFSAQPNLTRNQLISEIWQVFLNSDPQDLIALYKSHSLVLGKRVSYRENQISYTATAIDITDIGELIVQDDDGHRKTLSSGEISLTSW